MSTPPSRGRVPASPVTSSYVRLELVDSSLVGFGFVSCYRAVTLICNNLRRHRRYVSSALIHLGSDMFKLSILFALMIITGTVLAQERAESVCHGTPEKGSLERGWKLPASGINFEPYSGLGPTLGRTYVHSAVYKTVVGTYAVLAKSRPDTKYMYGETGKEKGGRIRPHKTHENGLSVDFMVPVKNGSGESVLLPTSPLNKFGYGIEFSSSGDWEGLKIDFDAMAAHLHALAKEAQSNGIAIRRVIFDHDLQSLLFADGRETKLKGITFAKFKPWVRHDEHYHVDFEVKCQK